MTDIMLVGPNYMLVGHEGRTWSQGGRRVIQNTESSWDHVLWSGYPL